MKIKYDKETDTLNIVFVDRPVKNSEYLEKEGIVVDLDEDSSAIGIEVVSVSKKWPLKDILRFEYEPVAV
ncbi:MAG: hypothetical protein CVU77_00265 [Elusimicrobia bacterium HGW-Elusimicrobia-1]|jgi:uncharacterized protein YuzE|nr:MAG: hypothetical protein CVU77_00265 [Elusimicrobia bacterium HGW-Elusimicrobia-1]